MTCCIRLRTFRGGSEVNWLLTRQTVLLGLIVWNFFELLPINGVVFTDSIRRLVAGNLRVNSQTVIGYLGCVIDIYW